MAGSSPMTRVQMAQQRRTTVVDGRENDFYSYVINFASLANGVSSSGSFSIDTDSDFILTMMTQQSDLALAAVTDSTRIVPLVTVQVTDGGSSRQLFSNPVPIPSVFGCGENPYILPAPRRFSAGSTINVAVANYSTATTYNLRLVFSGIKEYIYKGHK